MKLQMILKKRLEILILMCCAVLMAVDSFAASLPSGFIGTWQETAGADNYYEAERLEILPTGECTDTYQVFLDEQHKQLMTAVIEKSKVRYVRKSKDVPGAIVVRLDMVGRTLFMSEQPDKSVLKSLGMENCQYVLGKTTDIHTLNCSRELRSMKSCPSVYTVWKKDADQLFIGGQSPSSCTKAGLHEVLSKSAFNHIK